MDTRGLLVGNRVKVDLENTGLCMCYCRLSRVKSCKLSRSVFKAMKFSAALLQKMMFLFILCWVNHDSFWRV